MLAAAVIPPTAAIYDINSRLFRPRSIALLDMEASLSFGFPQAPIVYGQVGLSKA
jgi:hypothetical protein